MERIEDKVSEELVKTFRKINQMNGKNALKTLEARVDALTLCMALVERGENDLFSFKESNTSYDVVEVVNYDYRISNYAERIYKQCEQVMAIFTSQCNNTIVKMIPMAKKNQFMQLSKRMMEISARWHIERIINVYEFDTPIANRAFPKRKPLLQECIFFADRMCATRMGVELPDGIQPRMIIFAVQPSAGKSFVANVYSLMALCLHQIYYRTSGILRMSNNGGNACGFSAQIEAMIQDEKIVAIYPEFKKYFSGNKPAILDSVPAEEWKMKDLDPRIRASHFARGRDSAINSLRIFVALVIDDLSDGFDQMNNDDAHKDMTTKFYIDMDSRAEDEKLPVFLLGTMFNEYDVQNSVIQDLELKGLLFKDNKYKDVRRTSDFSVIVITVDCFDENGESKAPKLISTEKLRDKQSKLKAYEFDLVYRQIRASREPRIFDYGNLKLYDKLPTTLSGRRIAVLDPTRRNGADFFALPVFDFNQGENNDAYFIDCIYEQKSLGKQSDPQNVFFRKVVEFLIANDVADFYIENNTSNTLGTLFEEKFKEYGYRCNIIEKYTVAEKGKRNKTERILDEEATIVANIQFPKPSLFPALHPISLFMTDFTRYDSKLETSTKKQHDDAPDSVRLFSKECLFNRRNRLSEVKRAFSKASLFGRR